MTEVEFQDINVAVAKACGIAVEISPGGAPYIEVPITFVDCGSWFDFMPSTNLELAFEIVEKVFTDEDRGLMLVRHFAPSLNIWQWTVFVGEKNGPHTGKYGWHETPALAICSAIIKISEAST